MNGLNDVIQNNNYIKKLILINLIFTKKKVINNKDKKIHTKNFN